MPAESQGKRCKMALLKYGGGIIQISGSIAGVTHARNRFGNYARPRTKPVNPNSSRQVVIRSALSYLTTYWHETLTPANRTAWNTYAAAVAMKNKLGETVYLTGFNMFLRTNILRMQLGKSLCPDGPIELSLPDKDATFAISASAATQAITVTWDATLAWTEIAASVLGVWQGVPQIVTRNFFAGPWRMLSSIPCDAESPTALPAVMTLVEGQKIWCYGRIVTGPTDSRVSEPFYANCTIGV